MVSSLAEPSSALPDQSKNMLPHTFLPGQEKEEVWGDRGGVEGQKGKGRMRGEVEEEAGG